MKLKKITVKNLNNKISIDDYNFHDDINVVTGMNGSGKTTFLKIIWYTISGNIERIIPEISFDYFCLETSYYTIEIDRSDDNIRWNYHNTDKLEKKGTLTIRDIEEPIFYKEIHELNLLVIESFESSSLYFPTFRRIEGGYSTVNTRKLRRRLNSGQVVYETIERDDLQDSFDAVSFKLSVEKHKFVCSISTNDIVSLVTQKYAEVSEALNKNYLDFSTSIINRIKNAKSDIDTKQEESLNILNDLQEAADRVNKKRDSLFKPFDVLSEFTSTILKHKGIRLKSVTLGESVDAIDSSTLSAGEKQMLSFLCYNAFSSETLIFIDEPELSLHPDWQRRLFPTLLKQQSSNQFIIATHSPFIYSKYQDKEVMLSIEKGE